MDKPMDGEIGSRYDDFTFGDQSKKNIFKTVFETVDQIATQLQIDRKGIQEIHRYLHSWIWGKSRAFTNLCLFKDSSWVYWKTEMKFGNMSQLQIIALGLLSLPASQASCERLISQNRRIIDSYQSNMNDDLIKVRNNVRNAVNINPEIIVHPEEE